MITIHLDQQISRKLSENESVFKNLNSEKFFNLHTIVDVCHIGGSSTAAKFPENLTTI